MAAATRGSRQGDIDAQVAGRDLGSQKLGPTPRCVQRASAWSRLNLGRRAVSAVPHAARLLGCKTYPNGLDAGKLKPSGFAENIQGIEFRLQVSIQQCLNWVLFRLTFPKTRMSCTVCI